MFNVTGHSHTRISEGRHFDIVRNLKLQGFRASNFYDMLNCTG